MTMQIPLQFNRLIPELKCTNYEKSLDFYTRVLGFRVLYDRPEEGFSMFDYEGSQLMIDLYTPGKSRWVTGGMKHPLGEGINLQIEVRDVDALVTRVKNAGVPLFMDIEEKWYRMENKHVGNRQFLVQDPDGYLLRFFQDLGER